MTTLLQNENALIILKKNILYHKFYNKIPNESEIKKIHEVLTKFYDICDKNNTKFFHIYDFNDISIFSIPNISMNRDLILGYIRNKYKIFQTNLYCSAIIMSQAFIRKCLGLLLNVYTPTKPLKFVSNEAEAQEFFNQIKTEYKQKKWSFERTEEKAYNTVFDDNLQDNLTTAEEDEINNIIKTNR